MSRKKRWEGDGEKKGNPGKTTGKTAQGITHLPCTHGKCGSHNSRTVRRLPITPAERVANKLAN